MCNICRKHTFRRSALLTYDIKCLRIPADIAADQPNVELKVRFHLVFKLFYSRRKISYHVPDTRPPQYSIWNHNLPNRYLVQAFLSA